MAAAKTRARGRSVLRSFQRWALPPRHPLHALAPRQGAAAMQDRSGGEETRAPVRAVPGTGNSGRAEGASPESMIALGPSDLRLPCNAEPSACYAEPDVSPSFSLPGGDTARLPPWKDFWEVSLFHR